MTPDQLITQGWKPAAHHPEFPKVQLFIRDDLSAALFPNGIVLKWDTATDTPRAHRFITNMLQLLSGKPPADYQEDPE